MKGGQTIGVLAGITVALTLALPVSVSSVAAQSAGQALPTADVLACAPRLAALEASAWRLLGAPDNLRKRLFRQGDTVLINVGASSEVAVGTQFFTRRRVAVTTPALRDRVLHADVTTGWLRAVEVNETATLAVIERTCADVHQDDLLAPFQWPAPVTTMASGAISHDDPAMVLFGADGRALSAPRQMFVIDQGTDQGLALGQRVAVFRPGATPDAPVTELGEGVAVMTEAASATIHLRRAREPVKAGDSVAIQRP